MQLKSWIDLNRIPYIPFLHTHSALKKQIQEEFARVYDSHQFVLGDGLKQFESEYADYHGVNHAVGVGNGHDALLISLKCLEIGPGDEVIIPAHTFVATALPILHVGARPVLVDIDPETCNIDASIIEPKITEKTKAIIPVHLYGNPCDLNEIIGLAKKYGLHVIEDNAQAHGAQIEGMKTGSLGIINFTSFYPSKNLGAIGDGGMITTNSADLAEKAIVIRNDGRSNQQEYTLPGVNSRLDVLQARILSIKLPYLDSWNLERRQIAEQYMDQLHDLKGIHFQHTLPNCKNVHHIFPIMVPQRDALRTWLLSKGIEALVHYPKPIHLHPIFSNLHYAKGSFPMAEKTCASELSLPIYPGLARADISFVCQQIKEFYTGS